MRTPSLDTVSETPYSRLVERRFAQFFVYARSGAFPFFFDLPMFWMFLFFPPFRSEFPKPFGFLRAVSGRVCLGGFFFGWRRGWVVCLFGVQEGNRRTSYNVYNAQR